MILWLAAVCMYSIAGSPAQARKAGTKRLVSTALGGKAPRKPLEKRSRPVTVDVEPTTGATPQQKPTAGRSSRNDEQPDEKQSVPARDLGHTLPFAPHLASDSELREPHHDYPAFDLGLDSGTRIYAVTSGWVKATTKWGACGKGVILRGADHFTYTYCHGSKLLVGRGRHVSEGQGVMLSGNTGDSTGPHLHLQIRRPNGKLVCPQDLLPVWEKGIPKSPWEAGRTGCYTGGQHHHKKKNKKR